MLKRYKNLKIASKLIIGFLLVAIVAAVIAVIAIISISNIGKGEAVIVEENVHGFSDMATAQIAYQRIRYNVAKSVITEGTNVQAETIAKINTYIENTEAGIAKYQAAVDLPEEIQKADTLMNDFDSYTALAKKVIDMLNVDDVNGATALILGDLGAQGSIVQAEFDEMFANMNTEADARGAEGAKAISNSVILMTVIGAVGVLLAIILGIGISNLISKPLTMMAEDAEKLSLGHVDIQANSAEIGKDEIGKLTAAFVKMAAGRKNQVHEVERMADGDLTVELTMKSDKDVLNKSLIDLIDNLNDLVTSIQSSADQVSSGSNLVSDSSMALSQGATEQASAVQQLTASLQEIASQTTMNAENAQSANQFAKNAKGDAEKGNSQMKDMLSAMEDINESSSSINKIIKVIDDIAFQTNILALNAAVEAARAGQHGKGFAVVAEEVRTLAARSAQAAKETTDMIEGSIKKVEIGTKIANETAGALGKIVNEVAKAAELVEAIAAASNEQASAIEQINQGILQVSQVVQNNAATSEESAAASEELSSQAAQLKDVVSAFKVKSNGRSGNFENPVKRNPQKPNTGYNPSKPAKTAITQKANISLDDGNFGKY